MRCVARLFAAVLFAPGVGCGAARTSVEAPSPPPAPEPPRTARVVAPPVEWLSQAQRDDLEVDEETRSAGSGDELPEVPDGTETLAEAGGGRVQVGASGLEAWVVELSAEGDREEVVRFAVRPTVALELARARLLPLFVWPTDSQAWGAALLVDPDRLAYVVAGEPFGRALPLELAGRPGRDAAALAGTRRLRYMQACPASRRACLLYGDDAAVLAARDPLRPETGWSLVAVPSADLPQPAPAGSPAVESRPREGATLRVLTAPTPAGAERHPAWLEREGRSVYLFDVAERGTYPVDNAMAGVARASDVLVAMVLQPEVMALDVRLLAAGTGEPAGPALHVDAVAYDEGSACNHTVCGATPLPVLRADGLGVAIVGAEPGAAVYFETPDAAGRLLRLEGGQETEDRLLGEGLGVLVLELGEDEAGPLLRPTPPAP